MTRDEALARSREIVAPYFESVSGNGVRCVKAVAAALREAVAEEREALREVVKWAAKYVGNNTYEERVEARAELQKALAALDAKEEGK